MKASPLLLVLCLAAAPADAGARFGGAHGLALHNVNAVSDIEPGPVPPPPFVPAPPAEPASFAPEPEPVYLPRPYFLPPPPRVRMLRPSPQILYLRKPASNRTGPLVIYGAG